MLNSDREISNLVFRYAELLDHGELNAVGQLFSKAVMKGPDGEVTASGATEVEAMYRKLTKIYSDCGTPKTKHITSNLILEIDEASGTAEGRAYFTVLQATETLKLQPIIAGRYRDRFSRDEQGWHFIERQMLPELYGDLSQHLPPGFF